MPFIRKYENIPCLASSSGLLFWSSAAAVATTSAIGGFYLLPAGAALFGGGGVAIGSGISKLNQNDARQKNWADCMNKRGYDAYTGG